MGYLLYWFMFVVILTLPCQISWACSLLFVLYFFINANLQEKILFAVFLGTITVGFFTRLAGMPGFISFAVWLLIFVYLLWMISCNIITIKWKQLLFHLCILVTSFCIWYCLGPMTDLCTTKLFRIIFTIFYGAFQFIFLMELRNIRPFKIAPLFTFGAVFLVLSILLFRYHVSETHAEILRDLYYLDQEVGFNYQMLSIYSGMAVVFIMEVENVNIMWKIPLLLCNCWLASISGGRQVLITLILCIFFVCFLKLFQKKNLKRIIIPVIVFLLILPQVYTHMQEGNVWESLRSDNLWTVLNRDENTFDYMQTIWKTAPFLGSGLGGYVDNAVDRDYGETYPHNFFLEVFYEMGICGLCILLFPLFVFCELHSIKEFFIMRSKSSYFVLPFFAIYFIRSMISDGLFFSVNIVVFVCVMLASYKGEYTVQIDGDTLKSAAE